MKDKGQQADALNPAMTLRFAVGRHRRGVSDPCRWVEYTIGFL
jgi:hypothetical protein